jgi:hypothetical protein
MKTIRHIPALLFVCVLMWTAAARAQMGSMVMDSAQAKPALTKSVSPLSWAKLVLTVREGDTCNFASARLTNPISGDGAHPIANATVAFFVQRLFGKMPIADESTAATDDSGIAEIAFPKDFPGDANGTVTIVASIEDNALTGPLEAHASGKWGAVLPVVANPFPRALWEPRAPLPLIITFCILLGGVWITYGFVLSQLFYIKSRKQAKS